MPVFNRILSVCVIAAIILAAFPFIGAPCPAQAASDNWTPMTSNTTNGLNAVWGSASNDVFAVGDAGTIVHYNGSAWTVMTSNTFITLNGVWGSAANNVYAVGYGGTVMRYDGSTWSAVTTGYGVDLWDIWGTSANDIYMVGSVGQIYHYNGSTWTAMTSNTFNELRGIWGASGSDIFAVGVGGTAVHYNGSTWAVMTTDIYTNLWGVWGNSGADVFAVDQSGNIIHYNGSTWSIQSSGLTGGLTGVWSGATNNVYAIGYNGAMQHFNGSTWSVMNSYTTNNLLGIWGKCANDIFAVGSAGTILHWGSGSCAATGLVNTGLDTTLGLVGISVSSGVITHRAWIAPVDMTCSTPAGYYFPWGMFSLHIANLPAGGSTTLTLKFPTPLPLGTKYYKCVNGTMVDCTSITTRIDEYTYQIVLTDGGMADSDNTANGRIIDPGGPAYPQATTTSHGAAMPTTASQQPMQLANVRVKSASLSSTRVGPGNPVTVTTVIDNTGTGNGSANIKVYVNGAVETSEGVSVNSGGSTTRTYKITRNQTGTYAVYVGGVEAGKFKVDPFADPNLILFISGACIFFALIVGIIYMTHGRPRTATYNVRQDPRNNPNYDPRSDPRYNQDNQYNQNNQYNEPRTRRKDNNQWQ